MITYKLWETYIDENWGWREYDYDEIVFNVLWAIPVIILSIFTIMLDILFIPFYIVAYIIWYIQESKEE